jgi:hypothetical protein
VSVYNSAPAGIVRALRIPKPGLGGTSDEEFNTAIPIWAIPASGSHNGDRYFLIPIQPVASPRVSSNPT